MKIGILTFWKTEDNYGQLLQCYATQTFLRSLGHETFLVRATNGREYNPTLKQKLLSKLRTAYRLSPYPLYMLRRAAGSALYTLRHGRLKPSASARSRGFERFRTDYLNATQKEYTLEMLESDPPEADGFLVGSDQIWNTTDGIYFLSWAGEDVIKGSIAASFGSRTPSEEFVNLVSPWLRRFNLVTVREKSGLRICEEAGRDDARLVPDPTLMIPVADYVRIASEALCPEEPYLFVYFLGTRTRIDWKQIHRFARSQGLKTVYVGSQGQEDKFPKVEPAIEEWLGLMKNASFVITNSFHGTAFALMFGKRFMVYPVSGPASRMNDRLTTLLTPLQLSDRIYSGRLDEMITAPIDYARVHTLQSDDAARARRLISSILE